MHALLAKLGDPQRGFRAVHVVGTNGKSTTTRMTAALLRDAGLNVGAYTSPHVSGWHERLDTDTAGFARAIESVRAAAEEVGATQFETLTAAAFADFAARGVDAAVVEAGLGGRLDATNVLDASVVVLTNVGLEHTDVLGETRSEIAAEKLAVVREGAIVVLGEPEWEPLARSSGASAVVVAGRSNLALAIAAAESFLGAPVDRHAADGVGLPGRLERRGEAPLEIWDGAHTPDGVGYLLAHVPTRADYVLVLSVLADKDAAGVLAALSVLGSRLVATQSTSPRALPAAELAKLARPWFAEIETVAAPAEAVARARTIAGAGGAVLVTGSLYLLADLHAHPGRGARGGAAGAASMPSRPSS